MLIGGGLGPRVWTPGALEPGAWGHSFSFLIEISALVILLQSVRQGETCAWPVWDRMESPSPVPRKSQAVTASMPRGRGLPSQTLVTGIAWRLQRVSLVLAGGKLQLSSWHAHSENLGVGGWPAAGVEWGSLCWELLS